MGRVDRRTWNACFARRKCSTKKLVDGTFLSDNMRYMFWDASKFSGVLLVMERYKRKIGIAYSTKQRLLGISLPVRIRTMVPCARASVNLSCTASADATYYDATCNCLVKIPPPVVRYFWIEDYEIWSHVRMEHAMGDEHER